jgi:putative Mg2+ transporter-C (MgtC) family protein
MLPELLLLEITGLKSFILQIGVAMASGFCIGLEREFKGKQAGLKTNMLVAVGAAVFVAISLRFRGEAEVDITRVLSQVVIGIGFLGGGAILQKSNKIEGLTTAATIWCSAGAGCLAAVSMFGELAFLTVLVVIINIVFEYIDKRIDEKTGD